MAQPKLVSPDQPFALRVLLRGYEFCASLKLAVVLIFSMAFALGYATFVEAAYGTPVVQYFVYQTWWFNGLNILLGINIFCAAAIRYPWQRHQTGFVVTHIGLLVLLGGAAIGRQSGVDAQIPVFESRMERYAFDRTNLFFDVKIEEDHEEGSADSHEDFVQTIGRVPFPAGPFNWDDYATEFAYNSGQTYASSVEAFLKNGLRWTSGHVFKLAKRATTGTVLIDDTIGGLGKNLKIETLEFQANSTMSAEPRVEMVVSGIPEKYLDEETGREEERPGSFPDGPQNSFNVTITPLPDALLDQYGEIYPYGFSQPLQAGGGKVMLWIAPDATYQKAFLEATPQGELGTRGQFVLTVDDQVHHIDLAGVRAGDIVELTGSSYSLEVKGIWQDVNEGQPGTEGTVYGYSEKIADEPIVPTVHLQVLDAQGTPHGREVLLFANKPQHNVYDYENRIYGTYWFDFSTKEIQPFGPQANSEEVYSRIEFLQGADRQLYYRYWNRRTNQLVITQKLNQQGAPEDATAGFQMPQFKNPLQFYVADFISSDKPQLASKTLPFNRDLQIVQREVRAKVRVTWGDIVREQWIRAFVGAPGERQTAEQQIRIHDADQGHSLVLSMPTESIDIGFRIRLKDFERKLDPGTSQASHYSSWVDFVDLKNTQEIWAVPSSGGQSQSLGIPTRATPEDAKPQVLHQFVSGYAVDGDTIYWLDRDNRQLQSTDKKTGKTSTILDNDKIGLLTGAEASNAFLNSPRNLQLYGDTLFWVDELGGTSVIQSVQTNGNAPTRVVHSPGQVIQLIVDASKEQLYWLNSTAGQISRCNLEGRQMEIGIIKGLRRPSSFALDSKKEKLFWAENDKSATGTISRGVLMSTDLPKSSMEEVSPNKILTLDVDVYAVSMAFNPQEDQLAFIAAEKPLEGYIGHHAGTVHATHHLYTCSVTGSNMTQIPAYGLDLASELSIIDGDYYWTQSASYHHDVYITMNAPVEFDSPTNGHSYRLFQESFSGPWKPGDPEYERVIPADSQQEDLYLSVLTVNRDPGRAIRNLGCLIVCLGIAIMFYMKAYFFKPRRKKTAVVPANETNEAGNSTPDEAPSDES